MLLEFRISGQLIERVDWNKVVSSSDQYLYCQFHLPEEYVGVVAAHFKILLNGEPRGLSVALNSENKCLVPTEIIVAPYFEVSLTSTNGNIFIPTNAIVIDVIESGIPNELLPPPSGENQYEQMEEVYQNLLSIAEEVIDNAAAAAGSAANAHISESNAASSAAAAAQTASQLAGVVADANETINTANNRISSMDALMVNAGTVITNANNAAANANTKAGLAETAATDANNAASNLEYVLSGAEAATQAANTAATNANNKANLADTAAQEAGSATLNADAAANRANTAAQAAEDIVAGTGIVLQTDIGVPNGVAGLDANGKVSVNQLPDVDSKDNTTSFVEASTRTNIESGETHTTIFGKIKKVFSDLKALAWKDSAGYDDLDTELKERIDGKFDAINIINNDSLNDEEHVVSSAVTYQHRQDINALEDAVDTLNDNLIKITILRQGIPLTANTEASPSIDYTSVSGEILTSFIIGMQGSASTANISKYMPGSNLSINIVNSVRLLSTVSQTVYVMIGVLHKG